MQDGCGILGSQVVQLAEADVSLAVVAAEGAQEVACRLLQGACKAKCVCVSMADRPGAAPEVRTEAQAANLLALNSDHDAGRVVTVDLAEDCPDAFTLLSRCVPLSAYAGSGG